MITYRLSPEESFLAVFCLGFDCAGHIDTKRGDYLSLAERISEVPENGNLLIDSHDQARLIAAVDTTAVFLAETPQSVKKGVVLLLTHLRTGADAQHTKAAAQGVHTEETAGMETRAG